MEKLEVRAPDVIVLMSGGLDSATLLWQLLEEGNTVAGIGIDYGQRHAKELDASLTLATEAARKYGAAVSHTTAKLPALGHVLAGSSQTSGHMPVPKGHYADASMKATVVPNRNMILLAVAAGYAVSLRSRKVAYAAHAGDHPIYPDCRPEFADAMQAALNVASYEPIELVRPFIEIDKTEIARRAARLGVPIEKTWSCYEGRDLHCGACGTCVERIEALELAGVADPTPYRQS